MPTVCIDGPPAELQEPETKIDLSTHQCQNIMSLSDLSDHDDEEAHTNLPPPKDYLSRRVSSTSVLASMKLKRSSSWSNSGSDVRMEKAAVEVSSNLNAQSMPNLFGNRAAHNRVLGISLLASEQALVNGSEKGKRGASAHVAQFERLLHDASSHYAIF
jgi:hypothetical protein